MDSINAGMWIFVVILGFLAVLVAGAVGVYFWLKNQGKERGY